LKSIALLFLLCSTHLLAQQKVKHLLEGYLETYYAYETKLDSSGETVPFIYSHHERNSFSLNLGYLKYSLQSARVKSGLALMAGTYSERNLSAEPELLKHVLEAYVGYCFSSKKQGWIEAGIFPSHIGAESTIGLLSMNLTRSMVAEHSPYYESGIRAYMQLTEKCKIGLLLLNGWQRSRISSYQYIPAAGSQLTYQIHPKHTFNYNTFMGSALPDSLKSLRIYHNVYVQSDLTNKTTLIAGFDMGSEQIRYYSNSFRNWYTWYTTFAWKANKILTIAGRAEYFNDYHQTIIASTNTKPFEASAFSLNTDFKLKQQAAFRMEYKHFFSRHQIFKDNTSSQNGLLTASLCVKF
jgi:hypothetical protein